MERRLRASRLNELPNLIAPLLGPPPEGWVLERLSSGQALLLIDGIDEVPRQERHALRDWLAELVGSYPRVRVVVSSRPHAVEDLDLERLGFDIADLQPMELIDINNFIEHWHAAVREELASEDSKKELVDLAASLKRVVRRNRPIRILATTPLICAMLCALHRQRHRRLPADRLELYRACVELLLERREVERGIDLRDYPPFNLRQKKLLLEGSRLLAHEE